MAKNAVGSSWRKTLGSREWSKVPEEEKMMVREGALSLLLSGTRMHVHGRVFPYVCVRVPSVHTHSLHLVRSE